MMSGVLRWRMTLAAVAIPIAILWSTSALATISQGDLSIFGFVETREAGRWGEGSGGPGIPTTIPNPDTIDSGIPAIKKGGSFDFSHWDLVEARQIASLRPDYHIVKNYKLLGRFNTMILKDADFYAYYRTWYDAEGTLKDKGRAEAFENSSSYSQRQLQEEYFLDDLHEYYAQLNFTDNFSMRIGKQQIIWSEASLLSGTEITNPGDVSYHGFVGAEAPEDTRKGLRMVNADYLFPDFLKTANNELEAFWIPGDFEGATSLRSNLSPGLTSVTTDPRNPYTPPVSLTGPLSPSRSIPFLVFNQAGQQLRITSLLDLPTEPMIRLFSAPGYADFTDYVQRDISKTPSNSMLNSEFGTRFSTLLPLGNGLQTSFILLYEARSPKASVCAECPPPPGYFPTSKFLGFPILGTFFGPAIYTFGKPRPGVPKPGTILTLSTTDYRRNPYFGLTGTYYDEALTGSVFRYDALYAPRIAITAPVGPLAGGSFSKWTELGRFVLAVDRPTLVPVLTPYLSKQHTLLSLQGTETFYPDLPPSAIPNDPLGRVRRWSSLLSLTASNFLLNGQVATLNGISWDMDDQTGQLVSDNSYRYSRNILVGIDVAWYLGRSGRHTDPFLQSKSQRINELEFTLTYEI
jgi:hypothetical protein